MNGLLRRYILTLTLIFFMADRHPWNVSYSANGDKMKVAALLILGCLVWEGLAKPEFPGQLRCFFVYLPLLDRTLTYFFFAKICLFKNKTNPVSGDLPFR